MTPPNRVAYQGKLTLPPPATVTSFSPAGNPLNMAFVLSQCQDMRAGHFDSLTVPRSFGYNTHGNTATRKGATGYEERNNGSHSFGE